MICLKCDLCSLTAAYQAVLGTAGPIPLCEDHAIQWRAVVEAKPGYEETEVWQIVHTGDEQIDALYVMEPPDGIDVFTSKHPTQENL